MRPILELTALFLGSLATGCALAQIVVKAFAPKQQEPKPTVRIYEYRIRFNGAVIHGVVSGTESAASLALHGHGKPTVRA